jgi:hypothetical protein
VDGGNAKSRRQELRLKNLAQLAGQNPDWFLINKEPRS